MCGVLCVVCDSEWVGGWWEVCVCVCLCQGSLLSLSNRARFKEAHEAWKQHGLLSDLYVIIIDEIDAICKPRGGSISVFQSV